MQKKLWLRQGGYAKSVDSYGGYASEMNPKLKGKKVPQLPKEPVEEYIPPPFNANAPQVRAQGFHPAQHAWQQNGSIKFDVIVQLCQYGTQENKSSV